MTPEGRVKEAVKKVLKAHGLVAAGSKEEAALLRGGTAAGWYYMPVKGTPMGVNGIPDFMGVYRGRMFAIEAKAAGGGRGLSANQERRIVGIRAAGGKVFVIDGDTDLLETWLEEME